MSFGEAALDTRSSSTTTSASARWTASISTPSSSAAASTALSRFEITLWLIAVMPTFFPARTRSQIIRAPVYVLRASSWPRRS